MTCTAAPDMRSCWRATRPARGVRSISSGGGYASKVTDQLLNKMNGKAGTYHDHFFHFE